MTVTEELPDAIGVPLTIHPVSVRPAGNVPVIEQLYGGVPSAAEMVELYATPTVPFVKVLVIVSVADAIVTVSGELTFCCGLPESPTLTVTGEFPGVVGVPLTLHPDWTSPAGSAPVIVHV